MSTASTGPTRISRRFPSQAVLEIRVSCRNLGVAGVDSFGVLHSLEQHPYANASSRPRVPPADLTGNEEEVGRTEVIPRSSNPDFVSAFYVDHYFEEEQKFAFRLYHERPYLKEPQNDQEAFALEKDLKRHHFIGGFHFTLGQLVGAVGNSMASPLNSSIHNGFAVLHARPTKESSQVLRFQISAQLKSSGGLLFFGKRKHNPLYFIQQLDPTHMTWNTILKSKMVPGTLNPVWEIDEVRIQQLVGSMNQHIRIQVLNWDPENGKHEDMGGAVMTVNEMLTAPMTYDVLKATRRRRGGQNNNRQVGKLTVMSADILNRPTLVDYLTGGCQVSMQVAVDFTLSNGPPSDPKSLHYRHYVNMSKAATDGVSPRLSCMVRGEERLNDYQQVVTGLGKIVQDYDIEKQFPCWAFGAKINHHKEDCLELGRGTGLSGLLEAYNNAFDIPGFDLSGPTNFVPVLRAAADAAMAAKGNNQVFSVLFILTDGVATDMDSASDMICRIAESGVPIYIVIVGIGKADFKPMLIFGDGAIRDRHGKLPVRDIVTFVSFRNHIGNMGKLAAEVLHGIPKQIVDYYLTRNVKPNAPVSKPYFTEEKVFEDEQMELMQEEASEGKKRLGGSQWGF